MDSNDPRRAFDALLEWWTLAGVDVADARALARAPIPAVAPPPKAAPKARAAPAASPVEDARAIAAQANTLAEVREALLAYEGCALKKTARNTVFSDGIEGSEVMVVGEAPGKDEDEQGKPFIGRSGQLMDRMFASIGLSRKSNIFISNVIFWRPPGNRPPTQGELAACLPFIERAIAVAKPKMLLLMGGVPAQTLLRTETGVTRLRGKKMSYTPPGGTAVNAMVMLHPAYLLRRPQEKRLAWADLLMLEAWLEELGVQRAPRV